MREYRIIKYSSTLFTDTRRDCKAIPVEVVELVTRFKTLRNQKIESLLS